MTSHKYWYDEVSFPVTLCDRDGIILDMNKCSREQFKEDGGEKLIGTSLLKCHPEPSKAILIDLLRTPKSHSFVSKNNGREILVFDTPWYVNGVYQGFVEISLDLPSGTHIEKDA